MTYTQWNRHIPRLAIATSRNLKDWTKHGPAFAKAYDGKFFNLGCKSGSILTEVVNGKQVIKKIDGKYFMYWGEEHVFAATSEDLVNWTPYVNTDGSLRKLFSPRDGHFDSQLTECGPPAIYGCLALLPDISFFWKRCGPRPPVLESTYLSKNAPPTAGISQRRRGRRWRKHSVCMTNALAGACPSPQCRLRAEDFAAAPQERRAICPEERT